MTCYMKKAKHYTDKYPVYPGEFMPAFGYQDIDEAHKKRSRNAVNKPLINIIETKDGFKVEAAVPGVRREDFFLHARDNILSIIVLHKKPSNEEAGYSKLNEFNPDFFERNITLPETSDTQFANAEYREGMLTLYVPKADEPLKATSTRIVVY